MYIGEHKIASQNEKDGWVVVTFEGQPYPCSYTKRMFDALVTDKPLKLNEFVDRRVMAVVPDIVSVLLMWDVPIHDVDRLFNYTVNFLNDKLDRATSRMWNQNMKNRQDLSLHPEQITNQRTIGDLNNYLESAKDNGTNGAQNSGATS